jgi:hypothetical protein
MKVTRISILTGLRHTRDIAGLTEEQFEMLEGRRGPVRPRLAHLSNEDREFLISGITPEEWAGYTEPDQKTEVEPEIDPNERILEELRVIRLTLHALQETLVGAVQNRIMHDQDCPSNDAGTANLVRTPPESSEKDGLI